jgi:hypothetical protein
MGHMKTLGRLKAGPLSPIGRSICFAIQFSREPGKRNSARVYGTGPGIRRFNNFGHPTQKGHTRWLVNLTTPLPRSLLHQGLDNNEAKRSGPD